MAIISGSALSVEGIPINEEITSGSEFNVELEQGPGYVTLESKRDGNGFYTSPPNFASISGSNFTATVYGKHIISAVMGNTTSGSLSFIASRDIPANDIRVKVASPILNPKVNVGGGVDERFIITVKTDNAGTSASNQFTIPTSTTGITEAFLYDIETSDGQTITGVTGDTTITFPSAGEYDVKISGSFPYMYFNNGGDKLKLLDIKNFGIYALGSTSQDTAFRGCSNMVITATDSGNFGSVTNFKLSLAFCSSLTSFPLLDTSSGTTFENCWRNCSSLTLFPLIDTSSGVNFNNTWNGCSGLTSFPLIDTSSGTNFSSAWRGCSNLTSFPLINTSSGTNFLDAWNNCSSLATFPANAFDGNIATNYSNAFLVTNLTTQSIDDILVSLDTSGVSNGTFTQSGGQAPSATGEAAIDSLVGKGWTITVTGGYTP